MIGRQGGGPSPWKWAALLAVAVLVLASTGLAVDDELFELDGNPFDGASPGDDWGLVLLGGGDAIEAERVFEPLSTDTTYFTGGQTKDNRDIDLWKWGGTSVPDKDQIVNAFAALYETTDGKVLYFGLDRFAVDGDANVGFWFLQNEVGLLPDGTFSGVHTVDDLFVVSEFTHGGDVSNIKVYRWQGGKDPLNLVLDTDQAECAPGGLSDGGLDHIACAIVNSEPIPGPLPWPYAGKNIAPDQYPVSAFFEGGVALGEVFDEELCFTTFIAETRASTSLSSTLKDLALKTFGTCEARISISPLAATNFVEDPHDFTILVETNVGSGFVPADGVEVTASILPESTTGAFVGSPACTTGADGTCRVTIVSDVAGTTVVGAAADIEIANTVLHRETDGNVEIGNSGPAVKEWIKLVKSTFTETFPSTTSLPVGGVVSDTAVVLAEGEPVPGGSVTFFVCAVSPCTQESAIETLGTHPVDASGTATSDLFTPLTAGGFCFLGVYGGFETDAAVYEPSSDANPLTECFSVLDGRILITPATATNEVGDPHTYTITVLTDDGENIEPESGVLVTAEILAGSVGDFVGSPACTTGGDGTCTVTILSEDVGTTTVAASALLDIGGQTLALVTDGTGFSSEPAVKTWLPRPFTTTTRTTPSQDFLALGGSVQDLATVTADGEPVPGGSVTFFVCAVSPCTQEDALLNLGTHPVDGLGQASSDLFTPLSTGTFCFLAEYSGFETPNVVYLPSSDAEPERECFTVLDARILIAPLEATNPVGVDHDFTVTVLQDLGAGFGPAPGVEVTAEILPASTTGFFVGDPTCTTGADGTCIVTIGSDDEGLTIVSVSANLILGDASIPLVTDGSIASDPTGNSPPATKAWIKLVRDTFTETQATPPVITLGESAFDVAHVTSEGEPVTVGEVTFWVCSVSPCTVGEAITDLGTHPLDGDGMATSDPFTPLSAGTFCFLGEYGGAETETETFAPSSDANPETECFRVERATSDTFTTPALASIPEGGSNQDHATVTGLGGAFPVPTGTVTFFLCGPSELVGGVCTKDVDPFGTAALDAGGQAVSPSIGPLEEPGTWCFRAVYSGDENYLPSEDNGLNECFQVQRGFVPGLCPHTQGFWKNHPEDWPVDELDLGDRVYTKGELLAIFDMPVRGDASIAMAHQLIATLLSIEDGTDPAPIEDAVDEARSLLADAMAMTGESGLPYGIRSKHSLHSDMIAASDRLDDYNNGRLIPGCTPDLAVSKRASDETVAPGEPFEWHVLVVNHDTVVDAEDVTLTDVVAEGLTVLGVSSTQGSCSVGEDGRTVTCDLGKLAPDASAVVTIRVSADEGTCGSVRNTATATAKDELAENTGDNTGVASTFVDCP